MQVLRSAAIKIYDTLQTFSMNWYLVKLVYRIIFKDSRCGSEFDEQIRLLYAEDNLHAFQKARLIGDRESCSQSNTKESLVQWKFIDVTEIHKLDTVIDGAEMYSHISAQENADTYIRTTRKKALYLFDHTMEQLTEL